LRNHFRFLSGSFLAGGQVEHVGDPFEGCRDVFAVGNTALHDRQAIGDLVPLNWAIVNERF
jgi:hypothetical protein